MCNTATPPDQGPGWCTFCTFLIIRHASNVAHSATIGWEIGHPLCAEVPLIGDITEVYPSSIRSLLSFSPEERSNNAQRCPSHLHTFRTLRRKKASHPGDSSLLEPRASSLHTRGAGRADDVTPAVGGEGEVYPGWYTRAYTREVYSHHGTPVHIPGRAIPTMVPVVYAQGGLYSPWCPLYTPRMPPMVPLYTPSMPPMVPP